MCTRALTRVDIYIRLLPVSVPVDSFGSCSYMPDTLTTVEGDALAPPPQHLPLGLRPQLGRLLHREQLFGLSRLHDAYGGGQCHRRSCWRSQSFSFGVVECVLVCLSVGVYRYTGLSRKDATTSN